MYFYVEKLNMMQRRNIQCEKTKTVRKDFIYGPLKKLTTGQAERKIPQLDISANTVISSPKNMIN